MLIVTIDSSRFVTSATGLSRTVARPLALRPRLATGLPLTSCRRPEHRPLERGPDERARALDGWLVVAAAAGEAAAGAARAAGAAGAAGAAAEVTRGAAIADGEGTRVRRGVEEPRVGVPLRDQIRVVVQRALRVALRDDERPLIALPVLAGGVADEHVVDDNVLGLGGGGGGRGKREQRRGGGDGVPQVHEDPP